MLLRQRSAVAATQDWRLSTVAVARSWAMALANVSRPAPVMLLVGMALAMGCAAGAAASIFVSTINSGCGSIGEWARSAAELQDVASMQRIRTRDRSRCTVAWFWAVAAMPDVLSVC